MRKQRLTRTLGVITTLAVVALTFEFVGTGGGGGLTAGASEVKYTCDGVAGDNAGDLGSSKDLVGALKTFAKISALELPLEVVVDAPSEVEKGSAPFQARIGIGIKFDPSLTKTMKDTLGKTTLDLKNLSFDFTAENGGTTISGALPDQTVNIDAPPPLQYLTGTVTPSTAGLIAYVPGTARISVAINAEIAKQKIGTMTLECRVPGGDPVGYTAVRIPGAPRVAPITFDGHGGVDLFQVLGKGLITPDQGNPIIPDSLKLLGQPIGGGFAAASSGWVGILNAYSGGSYRIPMEICANSIPVPAIPGNSEIQSLTIQKWDTTANINAHPLGFTLKVGDQETAVVRTSKIPNIFYGFPGQPQYNGYTPLRGADFFTLLAAKFVAPTPLEIQKAIEALPNVGVGNVKVTQAAATPTVKYQPYLIEYVGALAEANMPDLTIGKWYTHADYDQKAKIFDAANDLAPKPGEPTGPPAPTQADLDRFLREGNFNAWYAAVPVVLAAALTASITGGINVPALLKQIGSLFPEPPLASLVRNGKATIPPTETGILCTPFQVAVKTPPNQLMMFYQALDEAIRSGKFAVVQGATLCKVKVATKVRVSSRGRTRLVTRYVTKSVPCKPKAVPKKKRR